MRFDTLWTVTSCFDPFRPPCNTDGAFAFIFATNRRTGSGPEGRRSDSCRGHQLPATTKTAQRFGQKNAGGSTSGDSTDAPRLQAARRITDGGAQTGRLTRCCYATAPRLFADIGSPVDGSLMRRRSFGSSVFQTPTSRTSRSVGSPPES